MNESIELRMTYSPHNYISHPWTVPMYHIRLRLLRNERVGSDSGGEGCSIFYLEMTGEAVLIGKTEVEETQF